MFILCQSPMSGPLNGPMNYALNGPLNSPLNGPLNSPMNGPFNSPARTLAGLQSEITIDKYGRVKVQFQWDREGKKDENSSCWICVPAP